MSDQRSDETPEGSSPDDAWRPTADAGRGAPTGDQRPVWAQTPETTGPDSRGDTGVDEGATGDTPTGQTPPTAPGAQPTEELPAAPAGGWTDGAQPTQELPATPEGASAWAAPTGSPVDSSPVPGVAASPVPGEQAPGEPLSPSSPSSSQEGAAWSAAGVAGAPGAPRSPWQAGAATGPGTGGPAGTGGYGTVPGPQGNAGVPGYQGAQPQNLWAAPLQAPPTRSTTRRKRGAPGWLALLVAMVVTALVSVGGTYALVGSGSNTTSTPITQTSSTPTAATTVSPVTSSGDSADWQAVATAVSPAVVTITVDTQSSESVGSGVIFDASGHVVTNYHVISEAASASAGVGSASSSGTITVTLADGRVYTGSIVGEDQTTDLAVIQIDNAPSDLTVASFGSSSKLTVGQQVMAIGAPLGLSNTVTTGVISALNRPVEVSTSDSSQDDQQTNPNDPFGQLPGTQQQSQSASTSVVTNAIQVDASINPGNSGGPLFDQTGAVIGINSSIASTSSSSGTAGSIGLGFAIPVNLVTSVVNQLISTGKVDHAVLGVTIQSGTATVDGTTQSGAEIASVSSGSGAEKAGLKKGDVILAVDSNAVTSAKSLTGFIRTYKGGDQVTITYVRDGKKETATVTLQSTE